MSAEDALGLMIIAVAPAVRDDIGSGERAQNTILDPTVIEALAKYYISCNLPPDYVLNNGRKLGSFAMYRAAEFFTKEYAG